MGIGKDKNTPSGQPTTAAEVVAFCAENDVRFVRLWFTDLLGQLKSFSINASELEDAFEGGAGTAAVRACWGAEVE